MIVDKSFIKHIVFQYLMLLVSAQLFGQINRPVDPVSRDNPGAFGQDSTGNDAFYIEKDSFEYDYFHLDNIFRKLTYADTLLAGDWSQVDKLRMQEISHINLGNFGSSSRPLVFSNSGYTGFNRGFDQYKIYNYTADSIKFYDVNRPLADLYFSPFLGTQQDFVVAADMGQRFANGISMSMNFYRVAQQGFYVNQKTKTTNIAFGLRKVSMQGRLNTFFVSINNFNNEAFNGGVTTDTLFQKPNFNFRTRIPVERTNANLRNDEKNFILQNTYRLGDTIVEPSDIVVQHRLTYHQSTYRFFDTISNGLENFYGPYFIESRGMRLYNGLTQVSNDFSVYNSTKSGISGRLGIVHDFIRLNNEFNTSVRNDITAYAQGKVPIKKVLELDVYGRLGLGSNAGKFLASASLSLKLGKFAILTPEAKIYNTEPTLAARQVAVNGSLVVNNDFSAITGLTLSGSLQIPYTRTNLFIEQDISNNAIYWDTAGLATQINGALSKTRLSVRQNFAFFNFHLDNQFTYQLYSSDKIQLPPWFSKHSLYYQNKLFKKVLEVQLGIEREMIPSYKGLDFLPLLATFHNTEEIIPAYNMTNAFVNVKVSQFRFFFRLENAEDFLKDSVYFQTAGYPWNDGRMRLGIRWQFLD